MSASVQWHNFLTAISIWPSINRFLIEQRAGTDYPRRIEQFEEEVNELIDFDGSMQSSKIPMGSENVKTLGSKKTTDDVVKGTIS